MRQQRGVALITAVLIMALVAATAVAMASKQQLDIRRSANIFNNDIAYLFVLGAEDYARNVLEWDITQDKSTIDHTGENWAQTVSVPVEGAMLTGTLQDLQGRINLNSLIDANGKPNALMQTRFKRLLKQLDLDDAIADAVLDWIDEDITPTGFGGAEDDVYMLETPPYRAANNLMVSSSELMSIKGIDAETYEKLAPFVATLPVSDTKININTAPAEVLATLTSSLTVADGEALVEARGEEGFATLADFTQHSLMINHQIPKNEQDSLDVQSAYFMLGAAAEFDQSIAYLHSVLKRDNNNGEVRVVMRSRGAY